MASTNVRLKLLIDTKARKVLFAEAGKDLVDFLFYLLSLPLGTVVKILSERSMVGCLTNLYGSIENLDDTYIQKNQSKDSVLNPRSPLINVTDIPLLLDDQESTTRKFYTCTQSGHYYVADVENMTCPYCNAKMTKVWSYVSPPNPKAANKGAVTEGGGFVKGVVTYMIMDNLEVTPMSAISSFTLLNKFNVKDVGALEEKVVVLGVNEGLKLLRASMESKNVLTTVFLGN